MWKWLYKYKIILIVTQLSVHDIVGNTEWDRLGGFQSTVSFLRLFRLNFIQFGGVGIMFKNTATIINAAFLIFLAYNLRI